MNWNSERMSCDEARAAIADSVIVGSAGSEAALDAHIAACGECRGYREECRRLWSVLGTWMVVFALGYMTLALSRWLWLGCLIVVVAHLGGGGNWILSTYGLQRIVPDYVRGRVFSVDYMVSTVIIASSQVLAGSLADRVDPRWVSFGLGSLVLLYAVGWLSLTRSFRREA